MLAYSYTFLVRLGVMPMRIPLQTLTGVSALASYRSRNILRVHGARDFIDVAAIMKLARRSRFHIISELLWSDEKKKISATGQKSACDPSPERVRIILLRAFAADPHIDDARLDGHVPDIVTRHHAMNLRPSLYTAIQTSSH